MNRNQSLHLNLKTESTDHRDAFIPYGRHDIDEADMQAVLDVLNSDWLTTGPKVTAFEKIFCDFVETAEAVAVSSGTAALHAAMNALGIGPGDEVILPPITFAATANAIVFQGGTPVFADVLPDTLLLDPDEVAAKITSKTKAIVAVDYAGNPCNYDALKALAATYGLFLVSDACHALGASYKKIKVGSLADITAFSFHPVKHITTGEGGMATTNRSEIAEKMRRFRNHGIDADHHRRAAQNTWYYEMLDLGYNYRISDLQCALGISQMKKLPAFLRRRHEIAVQYDNAFKKIPGVSPLVPNENGTHAYHLFVLRIDSSNCPADRDRIFTELRSQGLGVNVHYYPVHLHPYYRKHWDTKEGLCPAAEKAFQRIISLPIFPAMRDDDVEKVIHTVEKTFRRILYAAPVRTKNSCIGFKGNQKSRLVLGTAQLGMSYGIVNESGKPDSRKAEQIIALAMDNGICEFDTAQAYGTSEKDLGGVLKRLNILKDVKIVSKLHPDLPCYDPERIRDGLFQSLERLGIPKLYGLMLHKEELLDMWDHGLGKTLLKLKDNEGLLSHIGVSVYSPQKAMQALAHKDISIVQLPSNLLDRRFEKAGVFETAAKLEKTLYVRSIFLQGLILAHEKNMPPRLGKALPIIRQLDRLASECGMSRSQMALGYAKYAYPGAKLVIGAEIPEQLQENLSNWNMPFTSDMADEIRRTFHHVEERILNPSLWEEDARP